MLFCSLEFLPFFLVVCTLYWLLPSNRARVGLLLLASFGFYSSWNQWLALLIVGSSTLDFAIGRGLETITRDGPRRVLLATSLLFNLGLLAYFKYMNFFVDSLRQGLRLAGFEVSPFTLSVMLPVGISFYTFEAISYTVDVYRGRVRAERNLAHLLLFILFFPHLVAGPIVRASHFLPQIARAKRWSWLRAQLGVELFLLGMFKKLVIADHMAVFADPVFADPGHYNSKSHWFALIAYTAQIYGDFSGYSDMAIGLAHLFGFRLPANFRRPYLATSMSDFWHRWHISLSTWLRDYVFIPLGGSRGTPLQTDRNLLITMGLGGLWHGASWPFVLWGVLHGLFLICDRRWRQATAGWPRWQAFRSTIPGRLSSTGLVVLCFALSLVLFRAPSLSQAQEIYQRLFWPASGESIRHLVMRGDFLLLAVFMLAQCVGEWVPWQSHWRRLPPGILAVFYALAALLVGSLAPPAGKLFIYFQF